jgi:N-acyl-D-aspartate/D-glutamate deacylase
MLDLAINDGLFFDGRGSPARVRSVGVREGVVVELRDEPFAASEAREIVSARGRWVMPGFVDCHTHYDAEVEGAPALVESLRHGVTTVMLGGCSLGAVYASPVDLADMFTRVEGIPREEMLPLMERRKTWCDARSYRAHFDALPLGPNVAAFVGHSDLRAHVMGLGRSVDPRERPTREEHARMRATLEDALDAGFLGASVNANTWDKLGGTRHRSQPLPSTFASWSEVRRLTRLLRERGRIFQGIPNISTKVNALLFLWESTGIGRKPLKTNLVSWVDVRSNRGVARALGKLSRLVNGPLRGDFRWQALPVVFDIFADGVDVPVFEELGAGSAALHLADMAERRALFRDPKYRRWFRRQWTSWLLPRVFHRDFNHSRIETCPDASVVGKSFAEVARERGVDVVDAFLDLCAEHNDALRWSTVIGNDRPRALRGILSHPDILVGFSDAGAHLRNMAFYNMHLRMLRLARDAEREGVPFLSIERAVWRCTGELAEWFGIDAGVLDVGRRADLVVVDPEALDDRLDALHEAPIPELGGYVRMVRRNDATVPLVVVSGEIAWRDGARSDALGVRPLGRFLPFGEPALSGPSALRSAPHARASAPAPSRAPLPASAGRLAD